MRMLLIVFLLFFNQLSTASPIVMGYWENWSTYKDYPMPDNAAKSINGKLAAQISGLTALSYAFLEVDNNGTLIFSDSWSDLNPNSSEDKRFCSLYKQSCKGFPENAGLGNFGAFTKTDVAYHVISVGGAAHDDAWENAFRHPDQFVVSLKAMVDIYHINWLDIDYEPVGGVPVQNIPLFIQLVEKIRAALPNLIISYTLPANAQSIQEFGKANWDKLNNKINFIGVMGYDMHGSFDKNNPKTALHSALFAEDNDFSTDSAVKALNSVGINNSKIILGMPMYGRAVGGVQAPGIGQLFSQAIEGDLDEKGCDTKLDSKNICGGMIQYKTIIEQDYKAIPVTINNKLAGVYAYDTVKKIFISYDNAESAKSKAEYVINNKLAGVLFWALRYDLPVEKPQSILGSVDKVFGISPKPIPEAKMKLQITNNDPRRPITISLVKADKSGYYPFPSLKPQGQKDSDVLYTEQNSAIVKELMTSNQVLVLLTPEQGNQVWCESSLNFTMGSYHHIQVYYDSPKPNCLIQ